MESPQKQMWAKVVRAVGINASQWLCVNQDGEFVLASVRYGTLCYAKPGDIISFVPEPFKQSPSARGGENVCTWYARMPRLIARRWTPQEAVVQVRRGSHEDISFEEAFKDRGETRNAGNGY